MKKYVALLRGINVGGNNKISMAKLKECFLSIGFANVVTYINSGNVIFDTARKDEKRIITDIEDAIKENFDLQIPVLIRDARNIGQICRTITGEWQNNKDQKTDVMFLWEESAQKSILDKLPINKDIDTVRYMNRCIVWHVLKSDYDRSGMHDIVKSKIYKAMTVRNINTVRKINDLMKL